MTQLADPMIEGEAVPLRATEALLRRDFGAVRQRMMLDFCKWDAQVGDVSTLAPFAFLMPRQTWSELSDVAEALASETLALESALLCKPELHRRLGLPRILRRVLDGRFALTPAAARVMRFDFHFTNEGWRVSEVNSDVPGGFNEASAFTSLMSEHFKASPTGDPGAAYADALAAHGRTIVLISAPGFLEDQQVVAGLARSLESRGRRAILAQPKQLQWRGGRAFIGNIEADAIVRFYQAEWLARLPKKIGLRHLFVDGKTRVANPGAACLTESKRLPLVWDEAGVELHAWPRYLPETRDPSAAPWRADDRWLLKSAYCNTGDSVSIKSILTNRQWRSLRLDALLHPTQWVAQRRFFIVPIATPIGSMYPCVGVYVINGCACGIYGRLSPGPLIRYDATDVAVLLEE